MAQTTKNHKAIFLDRDGTINLDKGYVYKIEDFVWLPKALDAMKLLACHGFALIIVTNQSGIARKFYTEEDLSILEAYIQKTLKTYNCQITAFYHCPHLPEITGPCHCRKPAPGMLLQAQKDYQLNLKASWLIGDRLSDIKAAQAANVAPIKLGSGTTQDDQVARDLGIPICPDLYAAAKYIVN
ncbi:MAG: HAD family hydrolase [Desulfovibrionaceae bacterium]|nr:HAD family hydrolase [Desulfovibrionaceae bacterium]